VFEDATRLAHDIAKLDLDSLKIGKDPLAARAPKFGQQHVPRRDKF
jgi:hypothetical protein